MLHKIKPIGKVLGWVILVLLIGVLLVKTDFKDLWHHINRVPISILLKLLLLQVMTQLLLGYQWYRISKATLGESGFWNMFYIVSTGNVIEAVTPGAKIGGELTRLYYIKKELGTTTSQGTHIIIIQKSVSMSVLLVVCVTSFLYVGGHLGRGRPLFDRGEMVFFGVCLILGLLGLLFFARPLSVWLERFPKLGGVHRWLHSYAQATQNFSTLKWLEQFGVSMLVWGLFPLKMEILAESLGIQLPFFLVIAITMTAYFAGMIPLTPGGIGTFEGTMILLLGWASVGYEVALTMTVVFRGITFWFVIFMSTVYVGIYRKMRRISS